MSSSSLDPRQIYNTGSSDASTVGLGGVVRNIFAMQFLTVGYLMTRGLDALSQTFIKPLIALGDGGAAFVNALFADPAAALSGAWEYLLYSVTEGSWAFFGPLTPLVVLGVILAAMMLYLRFSDTYDIDLPTTGDIPFLGLNDSGASEED